VIEPLRDGRIDLLSVSGHKIYAPKGIGALIARKRQGEPPPLAPLMFGGGQEGGLRPGTLPVPLIAGLGMAARLALRQHAQRAEACRAYRQQVLEGLAPLAPVHNGEPDHGVSHTVNLSFPGLPSETIITAVKDLIAISATSACTAHDPQPSHVLRAMGLNEDLTASAVRLSWCHLTEPADWPAVVATLRVLCRTTPISVTRRT
jgi:cysteine desulfurase